MHEENREIVAQFKKIKLWTSKRWSAWFILRFSDLAESTTWPNLSLNLIECTVPYWIYCFCLHMGLDCISAKIFISLPRTNSGCIRSFLLLNSMAPDTTRLVTRELKFSSTTHCNDNFSRKKQRWLYLIFVNSRTIPSTGPLSSETG